MVYEPGAMILMYTVLYDHRLHLDYRAIASDSLVEMGGEAIYDPFSWEYFQRGNKNKKVNNTKKIGEVPVYELKVPTISHIKT